MEGELLIARESKSKRAQLACNPAIAGGRPFNPTARKASVRSISAQLRAFVPRIRLARARSPVIRWQIEHANRRK